MAKSRVFMGLDLSLTGTGCVVLNESGAVIFHHLWGQTLKKGASVRDKIERMIYIAEKIVSAGRGIIAGGAELSVGIENFAFGARGAQNDLGELQGVVKSQVWMALHVEPVSIPVSVARKTVTGKGNYPKKDIASWLMVNRGVDLADHNEADAYVIAECLRSMMRRGDDDGKEN